MAITEGLLVNPQSFSCQLLGLGEILAFSENPCQISLPNCNGRMVRTVRIKCYAESLSIHSDSQVTSFRCREEIGKISQRDRN